MSREIYLFKFAIVSIIAGGALASGGWMLYAGSQKDKYEKRIQALEREKAALIERIPKSSQLENIPATQPVLRE